ncbi:DUF1461 domain-containing protein [Pseudomonadota bacterium]
MWWFQRKPSPLHRFIQVVLIGLTPMVLLLNSINLVASDPWLNFEYNRLSFPRDSFGYSVKDRVRISQRVLAFVESRDGLASLSGEYGGVDSSFDNREILHLEDVRSVFKLVSSLYTIIWICWGVLAWSLAVENETRRLLSKGLIAGGVWTLTLTMISVLFVTVTWDWMFVRFHQLLFIPGTWQFAIDSNLIRLFPETFWVDSATAVLLLTALQSVGLSMIPVVTRNVRN